MQRTHKQHGPNSFGTFWESLRTSTSLRLLLLLLAFVCAAFLPLAYAGKKTYVGKRFAKQQLVSIERIDHSPWNALLQKYVDKDGLVKYAELKRSRPDRAKLDGYLRTLSSADLKAPAKRESQLAYWINAYNAVTVHGILREYPTTSIRKHTSKVGGYNIWHDYHLLVGDQSISLDDIEHKVLRKMNEPRIHFAIVCASIGCPRLLNEAYVSANLNEQLEINAKDFFSRQRHFQHDMAGNRFHMSSILNWFGGDFGGDQAAQLKTISQWLPTAAAQKAAANNAVSVKFLVYDWDLNDQAPKR